jgi:pantoate--beta-alanine ligase
VQIIQSIAEMRLECKRMRRDTNVDALLGLVPTMGAIHAGHLSLVSAARAECEVVAASIFVNPLQFAPTEDFSQYPRTFAEDCRQLCAAGVDLLFAPDAAAMYPAGATTFVEVGGLSERLDGASRPGHFRGVATIVAKLFHIVAPDVAYFGEKDAAQVAVLKAMVRDLDMDVRVSVCPTRRDADGLAMSSRNRYLSAEQRAMALALRRALTEAQRSFYAGQTEACCLRATMERVLDESRGVRLEYAEVVDPETLQPMHTISKTALLAVAAWVGETRLIDNGTLVASTEAMAHDA